MFLVKLLVELKPSLTESSTLPPSIPWIKLI